MNVLDTQVGGTHYTDLPHQPLDLIAGLNLDFFQGNVVKYLTRYKFKGAPVADLKKAADYCRKAHAYLDYKAVTDDYRTRATYAVEMHCEANGASEKVREAMLKAILYQWREAAKLIGDITTDVVLEIAEEERRCTSVGVDDFYTSANGDIVIGALWSLCGQYRILDDGGQYAVLHVGDGQQIFKGRYPTIDEAKQGVISIREADIEFLIRSLTDKLNRLRAKYPIK